jgi:hypothetical protein
MRLNEYRTLFIAMVLIGSLLIATPVLSTVLTLPGVPPFSEMYLLGSTQKFADYPYNVTAGSNYTVYLGVANHELASKYYLVTVKFADNNASLPNIVNKTSSPLSSLYETRFSLQDGETFQQNFTFAFSETTFANNQSSVFAVQFNGYTFDVNATSQVNPSSGGCLYWVIFELWMYNPNSKSFEYTNQYLALQLNFKPVVS